MNDRAKTLPAQRIAHISDVHLLDKRPSYGLRCRFVSIQRPLDALARAKRLLDALRLAVRSGAHHIVISGDLTEMGTATEFEHFAEVLHESKVPAHNVTLVPGNHDAYGSPDGWRKAIEGPLRAFASASAGPTPQALGRVVERGDLVLFPIDVTIHQTVARSSGELTAATVEALEARFADPSLRHKAKVVVQHHPPFGNSRSPWHFIDGLGGYARMLGAMAKHPEVQLLHGHNHQITNRLVTLPLVGESLRKVADHVRLLPRVFSASATVEDELGRPRVRLFDVRDGLLESIGLAA